MATSEECAVNRTRTWWCCAAAVLERAAASAGAGNRGAAAGAGGVHTDTCAAGVSEYGGRAGDATSPRNRSVGVIRPGGHGRSVAEGERLQSPGPAKTLEGRPHPGRNNRFRSINEQVKLRQGNGGRVVSTGAKKKELLCRLPNPGAAGDRWTLRKYSGAAIFRGMVYLTPKVVHRSTN
ncbi:hypothetical protein ACFCX0_42970 [Streptomyces sp. NPDC056352]|uniref:ISAzo13-like element transposase-related protein n=1 Tax=Streptomyces sp. NPDC056352 TaxID=3345791 RepID=UPI0035D8F0EF